MAKFLQVFLSIFVLFLSANAFKTKFTILHFNDINSQIDSFDKSDPDKVGNDGGLASLIGLLKKEGNNTKDVFRIAAGNLIGGHNGWLSVVGWEKFGALVHEFYKPSVMGLGHKEFEGGLVNLGEYLNKSMTRALINNVNCTDEKTFCQNFVDSSVPKLEIKSDDGKDKTHVGVVGFVNPIVERLANPGKLTFEDPATALGRVVDNEKDVKAFIAVGSGSLEIAKDILAKVDQIKIVILAGGSFVPDAYPTIEGGKYIVKAGINGISLGRLVLEIDSEAGTLTSTTDSELIAVDGKVVDGAARNRSLEFKDTADKAAEKKIGTTLVKLNASRENCWTRECNVGNLIADAMVHCALRKLSSMPKAATIIGVWPSGSMFDGYVGPANKISELDVHKWLPYHNEVYLVTVIGKTLKRMFGSSGGAINAPDNGEKIWGQFLQVSSGIHVKFNDKGEVEKLQVFHLEDSQPVLDDVHDDDSYNIVVPSFIYYGRSVYDYLPPLFTGVQDKNVIDTDDKCLHEYINGIQILNVGFERRITIGEDDDGGNCPKCKGSNTAVTVVLTLLIFCLIVGLVYVGWKFIWPRVSQRGHTSSFP